MGAKRHPTIGAFISPDTLVPDATSVFDYNRFMYVGGNPLLFVDPTGHNRAHNCMCGGGTHIGPSDYVRRVNNHLAVNIIESVPYADTANDIKVATTGCGYACEAGYEEPVGWFWRGVATAGIFLPFGYRSIRAIFQVAEIGSEV